MGMLAPPVGMNSLRWCALRHRQAPTSVSFSRCGKRCRSGESTLWLPAFHDHTRQCCLTIIRTSSNRRHVRCVIRPRGCPRARSRRASTGGASGADSTGTPRDWRRSPHTPPGRSITIAQAGGAQKAVPKPRWSALCRPTGLAADLDACRETRRRCDAGGSLARANVRSGPRAHRLQPVPACRRCCWRHVWGGSHRPLRPVRDLGHRSTDRVMRASAFVDRRAPLRARTPLEASLSSPRPAMPADPPADNRFAGRVPFDVKSGDVILAISDQLPSRQTRSRIRGGSRQRR
jgi:hypothetical protein